MKNKAKLSTLSLAILAMAISGCCNKAAEEENNNNSNPTEEKQEPTNQENNEQYIAPIINNAEEDVIYRIDLNKNYASMFYNDKAGEEFNEEITLTPTVYPRKVGAREIVWKSSNPSVATVDENGKVKAVGEGTTEVTCANKDDSVKASVHIVVNNMNEVKIATCNARFDEIIAEQNKEDFKVPDVITCIEKYSKTVTKNGKVIEREEFTQSITTSLENAYLRLTADDCEWRCEDGSPKLSTQEYVFHTTDEFVSYLFKTSGLTNNYMKVNQSNFLGKEKIDALKDICKNFFISGEGILTDNYEDILFQDSSSWLKSTDTNMHYGRLANVPGQLAFDVKDTYNQTATREDESDLYIPYGTPYVLNVENRILFENYLLTGRDIVQSMVYTIGEDEYVNAVHLDNYYYTGAEIEIPNKDNYSLVDGIFDL